MAGYETFAGSPFPLPMYAKEGPVVRAVRQQMAVIPGKTHTVEWAFGGIGMNPHHATPRNPWDMTDHRAPGGSSSGAGVSLWQGSAVAALGQRYRWQRTDSRQLDRHRRRENHVWPLVFGWHRPALTITRYRGRINPLGGGCGAGVCLTRPTCGPIPGHSWPNASVQRRASSPLVCANGCSRATRPASVRQ